ncbi:stalk domain-containing protein [Paenibacillus thalictri]|uniref:GH26 domain-containing protein n=1 Tax=Paenibacillus thalictri TaxID=2527873 RepID=A0A4Q9DF04_9BACL|nr:stalk domain-containing protein [Paenibacillus thalictri]TBL70383.1 hypothetical protein EYB31_33220 [Paenibacillus thalictri]
MKRTGMMHKWLSTVAACVLSFAIAAGGIGLPQTANADAVWDRWQAAEKAVNAGNTAGAIPHWKFLVDYYVSAGDWENAALFCGKLDSYYDQAGQYDDAIRYYELENEYWLKAGKDWGAVKIQRAEQIRTTVDAYMSVTDEEVLRKNAAPASGKLAKFEPEYGLYIGLYSEQDPEMQNYFNRAEKVYGKKHAIYLAYSQVGKDFPKAYAQRAKEAGGALQIAWEPGDGLDSVQDNDYLHKWAREAKASGIPIFLRYASEMNGNWVVWHGDPDKYIEKFRLVHDVMAKEAPNVAMVWSPNDVPAHSMDPYYPGDDYVDWVGVSLYTEPYENGDPNADNMQATSPVERLDELYRTYADRKPIMISETAVSHYAHRAEESFTDWALLNMDRLYKVMPFKYPRLKAITWYNVDLKDRESRNNYLLSANPDMKAAYTQIISNPYYLSEVKNGAKPAGDLGFVKADGSVSFAKKTRINPFVKTPDVSIGKLEYVLNGATVATQTTAPYGIELNAGQVPDGSVLTLNVYNKDGEKTSGKSFPLSSQVSVSINGKDQRYEQPPVIINSSTLAPLRAIFESFGASVSWNAETKTATAKKGPTTVVLSIGDDIAYKNGAPVKLDTPAQLVNGYTMAPARFVGETFGGTVNYDGTSRTVQITASGLQASAQSGKAGDTLRAAQFGLSASADPAVSGGPASPATLGGASPGALQPASSGSASLDASLSASSASSGAALAPHPAAVASSSDAAAALPEQTNNPGTFVSGVISTAAQFAAAFFRTLQAVVSLPA